jgi:uncharacterized membrane protein YdjX (TVP38/TMEM64 family)
MAFAGGALVVAVAAAAANLPVTDRLASLGAALAGSGPAGAALFALIYVGGVLLLVPAWTFSIAAGLLFGVWALPLSWSAMMAAAALAVPLTRRTLGGPVRAMIDRRPRLRLVADAIDEEGWRMVLLVRVSGIIPFGLQNYLLSLTGIRFGAYLAATAVGVLPGVLLHAGIGAFGQSLLGGDASLARTAVLLVSVLAALTLIVLTARRLHSKLR